MEGRREELMKALSEKDQADDSDGSIQKGDGVAKMKTLKKARHKIVSDGLENGFLNSKEKNIENGQKSERRKKKNQNCTDEKNVTKKRTKKDMTKKSFSVTKQENGVARSDSPGLDLSVFQPRGKRKCVLQNEAKKHRDDWWSDEEEEEEVKEEEEEEEIEDEIEEIEDKEIETKPIAKEAPKKRRKNAKEPKVNKEDTEAAHVPPSTQRCYVFSTGMANRAGHAVGKRLYPSITAYHHAQKWNTPYLNAEVHCRPFFPGMEEEEENKDLATGLVDLAGGASRLPPKEDTLALKSEENSLSQSNISEVTHKERTLSVDSWQKEQVIQVAKQMSRINNSHILSQEENNTGAKRSPLHPRFNLLNNSSSSQFENRVEQEHHVVTSTDSDSSPQTVPKFSEASIKEIETDVISNMTPACTEIKAVCSSEDSNRKEDLSSPPQLVPTYSHNDSSDSKSNSYPADITNLKEQLRYQSPKNLNTDIYPSRVEQKERPSVLSMATDRQENENIRSTIDVAEKELKESRTLPFKPTGPILPRDIHPSLFMSRHSPHLRTSAFNGHLPNTSIFSSRIHGPFSPPTSHFPSSFHSLPTSNHHAVHPSRSIPVIPPPFRHPLCSPNGFHETEKFNENYKPLSSSFTSPHHTYVNDRPSSLPVLTSSQRADKPPRAAFSVESLTKVYNRNDRKKDEENHAERNTEMHDRIPRTLPERPLVIPEHLHERLAAERLHAHNGLNLHNGLKRSLDIDIMERAKRDKKYLDSVHDERCLPEKDRYIRDKEYKERLMLAEKERFIHHPRLPFPDPRSPMRIPPSFLPRAGTNGSSVGELPSPPLHPGYPHLHRLHPFSSAPFTNR